MNVLHKSGTSLFKCLEGKLNCCRTIQFQWFNEINWKSFCESASKEFNLASNRRIVCILNLMKYSSSREHSCWACWQLVNLNEYEWTSRISYYMWDFHAIVSNSKLKSDWQLKLFTNETFSMMFEVVFESIISNLILIFYQSLSHFERTFKRESRK